TDTVGWGGAPSVVQGTCATPLAGTAIGETLSCTVLGLARSTAYGFQLVAFSGTLNGVAAFGALSNVATATTAASPTPSAPGTVTDLTVASATDTSVTLSFTQVSDGAGSPAQYDVRYAAGAIGWGAASSVARGSCAPPLAGTALGTKLNCTVLGLSLTTAYSFQLVAFRGTLNGAAVFGGLSNVASGTTAAPAPSRPPGAVADLADTGAADSSVTLSFTQVTDGAGSPAQYDVRYAVGTIGWGAASSVARGSGAAPLAGT